MKPLQLQLPTKARIANLRDHIMTGEFVEYRDTRKVDICKLGQDHDEPWKSKKQSKQYNDVWYRRFLKPIAGRSCQNRPVPYRESFHRRVLRPVGVPVAELQGIHEHFKPSHSRYSPLIGMIFSYNNFVSNLYRYGGPEDPAVELVRLLFHALPGGEILPTHLGSTSGAHLSAAIIGEAFRTFEQMQPQLGVMVDEKAVEVLADRLLKLIVDHPDYQEDRQKLIDDVHKAEAGLQELHQREIDAESTRTEIKRIEGDVIKIARHELKRAQNKLSSITPELKAQVQQKIETQQSIMDGAAATVSNLRTQIVTSLEFKTARKAFRRAQDAVVLERGSLSALVGILARSLITYDLIGVHPGGLDLPKYTTTAILLAFLWSKYDDIQAFDGYLESMARLGALSTPIASVLAILKSRTESPGFQVPRRLKTFSAHEIETAVIVTTGKPGVVSRPPVIPFSYVTWAVYSEFPDCGETAMRNLINQIVFNADTGRFDHSLLSELQDKHYPDMRMKLIDFYRRHPDPHDAVDHAAAREWINVVSNLNKGHDRELSVRYRRERQETNIASPLSNLLRALNALLGIDQLDENSLPELVGHINDARNTTLQVDTSRVKPDGFGIVRLTDGKVRYELQSYKPVHFGFVQTETLQSEATGRNNYRIFCRLMRHSSSAPVAESNEPAFFQQLALASLFAPYYLARNKVSRFFRCAPDHYLMLFANLEGPLQKQTALRWACRQQTSDDRLMSMMNRVHDYTEPTFMPTSRYS